MVERRPEAYLRVLETGSLTAGDPIVIVHEPTHCITVRHLFVALHLDHPRLPDLLAVGGLAPRIRRRVDEYLSRQRGLLPGTARVI